MRRTILLADDSPTIQRLVASIFTDCDYDIVSVSNGEAAIRKFEEIHPGAVLADIYMPGKNGYEVCAYVRQHASLGNTPVILLVGAFDAFDEIRANSLGATANITKPFEPQALITLVDSVFPKDPEASPAAPAPPPASVAVAAPSSPSGSGPVAAAEPAAAADAQDDLLGLESLFRESAASSETSSATEVDVDRIAELVMQRLSRQVVESIAWEVVPDIAEKVVREEYKRSPERQ